MVNHKEFFSEMSVTFLAGAYTDFDSEDKMRMERCSPPLMAPTVVERVQSKGYYVTLVAESTLHYNGASTPLIESEQYLDKVASKVQWPITNSIRGVWQLLSRRDSDLIRPRVPHCNKFYPFTKGQLEKHDPDLFAVYEELWEQIGEWKDEAKEKPCFRLRSCWPK